MHPLASFLSGDCLPRQTKPAAITEWSGDEAPLAIPLGRFSRPGPSAQQNRWPGVAPKWPHFLSHALLLCSSQMAAHSCASVGCAEATILAPAQALSRAWVCAGRELHHARPKCSGTICKVDGKGGRPGLAFGSGPTALGCSPSSMHHLPSNQATLEGECATHGSHDLVRSARFSMHSRI